MPRRDTAHTHEHTHARAHAQRPGERAKLLKPQEEREGDGEGSWRHTGARARKHTDTHSRNDAWTEAEFNKAPLESGERELARRSEMKTEVGAGGGDINNKVKK